jgi:hypothetical protein
MTDPLPGVEPVPLAPPAQPIEGDSHIVCGSVGLDVGGETIPYVAGWGEDGALDAIRDYAETIDATARRIEDAFRPASTTHTEHELADAA